MSKEEREKQKHVFIRLSVFFFLGSPFFIHMPYRKPADRFFGTFPVAVKCTISKLLLWKQFCSEYHNANFCVSFLLCFQFFLLLLIQCFFVWFFQPEYGSDSDSPASCISNTEVTPTTSNDAAARLFLQILQWSKTLLPFISLNVAEQVIMTLISYIMHLYKILFFFFAFLKMLL